MDTEPEIRTKIIEKIIEKPITKVIEVEKIIEKPIVTEKVIEIEKIEGVILLAADRHRKDLGKIKRPKG